MSESCAGCLHPLMDHDSTGCELCDCSRPHGRKPAVQDHTDGGRDA